MKRGTPELRAFHAAIKACMEIDPFMAIPRIDALLTWANDAEIQTIADLTETLKRTTGLGSSSVSRNVSYWTDNAYKQHDGSRPQGAGFIELIADPADYRRRMMLMTAKGEQFIDKVSEAIRDGLEK